MSSKVIEYQNALMEMGFEQVSVDLMQWFQTA
jgi:hypothetical protein